MTREKDLAARFRRWSLVGGWYVLALVFALGMTIAGDTSYTYDDLGRLNRVERADGTVYEYEYDAAGNITRKAIFAPDTDTDADGYPNATDCSPVDPDVYPGAPEINDGKDNQCPGEEGHDLVDEVTGPLSFADKASLTWAPQPGAWVYEVARSGQADFLGDCELTMAGSPVVDVAGDPPAGEAYFYLVRATLPNPGSWGADSSAERTGICP